MSAKTAPVLSIVAAVVIAALAMAPPSAAQSRDRSTAASSEDPRKAQALQSAERDRLSTRIADLKRQIAAGEKSRTGATAALARAERALSDVNRQIDELAARQRAVHERAAAIDRQRVGTAERIAIRKADAARAATRLYAEQDRDPLKQYLSGGDPNEALLTDGYLGYLARGAATDVGTLHDRANRLQAERSRADDDNRALTQEADARKSARESLAAEQAAQRQAVAQLSRRLAEQRNTATALEADEKRLTRVVEQLQRVIERQAAEERARREAARKRAERLAADAARRDRNAARSPVPQRRDGIREEPPAERVDAIPDDSLGSGAFARLRGQLKLPVRGAIVGRFGAPRGSGGGTWKGVFVQTDAGADVRAVAAGRVVFADDLRGFGNLLIVDHGDQYLSIYGNNETLLKHTGESVKPGDVISRSGNSSGDDRTGLYFELRFRGRPFDPLGWTSGR